VLRVLGNLLNLPEFDEESSEAVRDAVLTGGITSKLGNNVSRAVGLSGLQTQGLQRVADVAIYRSDAIVRRAEALQQTSASAVPSARIHPDTVERLGLTDAAKVTVSTDSGQSVMGLKTDATVAPDCVRLPVGFELTAVLGPVDSPLQVERA
jgi:NADH-quinone oxidoreductase subunit G